MALPRSWFYHRLLDELTRDTKIVPSTRPKSRTERIATYEECVRYMRDRIAATERAIQSLQAMIDQELSDEREAAEIRQDERLFERATVEIGESAKALQDDPVELTKEQTK